MTTQNLQKYLELAEKAVPEPWEVEKHEVLHNWDPNDERDSRTRVVASELDHVVETDTLKFIAQSRTIGPRAVKALLVAMVSMEIYLANEGCGETSCPLPMRAMCNNPSHKQVREALAEIHKILEGQE